MCIEVDTIELIDDLELARRNQTCNDPEGIADGSRGSSAANTHGTRNETRASIPEGSPIRTYAIELGLQIRYATALRSEDCADGGGLTA